MKNHSERIGAKEHSFFITFVLHGINIWTALRYFLFECFRMMVGLYLGLFIAIGVLGLGYFIFFVKKRASAIILEDISVFRCLISLVLTILYTIGTIYFMLKTGDYLRYNLYID
ncbi:hypothetical protein [Algoriphagus sp. Y33]|uniref:hypothetical protein n=1 Tax=Algoriphagus sp. Y33 TaxID=2772483 RepID=UPI00177DA659|nr:hypothetical protein [Algoriphagus sp. Y33]